MKNHTRIYMDYFNYNIYGDFVPCEICGNKAVDIHHIERRGMGGDSKGEKDIIENLMALCRICHNEYGDITDLKEKLKELHLKFMEKSGK